MDNLDALLDDLRATNQHILKSQNSSDYPVYTTEETVLQIAKPQTSYWAIDVDQNGASHVARPIDKAIYGGRSSAHMLRKPLQENLSMLDRMLNGLEESAFAEGEYQSQEMEFNEQQNWKKKTSNGNGGNGHVIAERNGDNREAMSLETKNAAAYASQQLDELMISLQQMKFQNSFSIFDEDEPLGRQAVSLSHKSDNTSAAAYRTPFSENAEDFLGEVGINESYLPTYQQRETDEVNPQSTQNVHLTTPTSLPVPSLQLKNGDLQTSPTDADYRGGACLQCQQPVIGKVITALGGVWHPEHFTCSCCQASVVHEDFFEHDGAPYCTDCHLSLFAPKCAYCGEAIVDRCLDAMGLFWHPDHFFCQGCHEPFVDNATAHEQSGKVFCQSCYCSMFSERCGGCRKPIVDGYIKALEQPWHEECFTCKDCQTKLSGHSFFAENGFLYCETHYRGHKGMICASCQDPISGRCISAMGKRYHPQHFTCTYCLRQLNTGTFKERASKPYCDACFRQLFG